MSVFTCHVQRNRLIYWAHVHGDSYGELAFVTGLHVRTIGGIVREERTRRLQLLFPPGEARGGFTKPPTDAPHEVSQPLSAAYAQMKANPYECTLKPLKRPWT